MPGLQRYVSDELTHCVGRGLPYAEQYSILIKILREGRLTHPPHDPKVSGGLRINSAFRFSSNDMYNLAVVCFCDIPVDDLKIHMSKYSRFGISFLKSFLVARGANPVWYIARGSPAEVFRTEGFGARLAQLLSGDGADNEALNDASANLVASAKELVDRAHLFDQVVDGYSELLAEGTVRVPPAPEDFQPKNIARSQDRIRRLNDFRQFLDEQVLSFVKFFDHEKSEDDPDNFYMEREWRIVGNVQFSLKDVERVLIPREYSQRFRAEFPAYLGQLTFVDQDLD